MIDSKNVFELKSDHVLESIIINLKRVKQATILGLIVSGLVIVVFILFVDHKDDSIATWRAGIVSVHSLLFFFQALMLGMTKPMQKFLVQSYKVVYVYQVLYLIIIVTFGVLLTSIDQQVVTNITPFVIVCKIMALVFLMKPCTALLIYLYSYCLFFVLIQVTQLNKVVSLSNQVNGFAVICVSCFLSYTLWFYYSSDYRQRLEIKEQQEELKRANEMLSALASHDALTGLYNRREFEKIVQVELKKMKRLQTDACIIVVDIDNFKRINDIYGHPVGDRLLIEFSELLKAEIRDIDVVSRWGGEEFILLLNETPASSAIVIAERIRMVVERNIFLIEELEINITASFGLSNLESSLEDALFSAYKNADKALYSAKESGRNRCVLGDIFYKSS